MYKILLFILININSMKNYEFHFNESATIRETFWNNIGNVNSDILWQLINPVFTWGPAWPSLRQSFKVINKDNWTIIATDWLSDPYSDYDTNEENKSFNGLGLEFYIETPWNIEDLQNSRQFEILYEVAQNAAHSGNYLDIISEYWYVTTEVYSNSIPQEFLNSEWRCGVMLGINKIELELTIEKIQLINIKLLTLKELEYVSQNWAERRTNLVNLFIQQWFESISSISRPSVI